MTMLQLMMPWEFGSFLPKITLQYWSSHPTHQIWTLVTSFCFPNSRKSSKELVFNTQKPLNSRDKKAPSGPGGILPGVRGSDAEEIGKVHPSLRRLLWRQHVVKFTCQIKYNIYRPNPVSFQTHLVFWVKMFKFWLLSFAVENCFLFKATSLDLIVTVIIDEHWINLFVNHGLIIFLSFSAYTKVNYWYHLSQFMITDSKDC